jgi:hypothetical protein
MNRPVVAAVVFLVVGMLPRAADASPFVINVIGSQSSSGLRGGGPTQGLTNLTLDGPKLPSGGWRLVPPKRRVTADAGRREIDLSNLVAALTVPETVNLNLGSGDYLTVSGPVADSILIASPILGSPEVPPAKGAPTTAPPGDAPHAAPSHASDDSPQNTGPSVPTTSGVPDVVNTVTDPTPTPTPTQTLTPTPTPTETDDIISAVLPDLVEDIVSPVGEIHGDLLGDPPGGPSPIVALESVPEPGTLLLLASGIAVLAQRARRPRH